MNLNEVRERIQNQFKVLRDKRTNKPLGIAYSEAGLQWLCNKTGKALYFKNAHFSNGELVGNTEKSNRVYVEDFNPNLEDNFKFKQLDINWMAKANRMLY
jgi:hypothetical protein